MLLDPVFYTDPHHLGFRLLITAELPQISIDDNFMSKALQKYGKMDWSDVHDIFTDGKPPFLEVVDPQDDRALMRSDGRQILYIPSDLLAAFEGDNDVIYSTSGKAVHALSVWILESLILGYNSFDIDLTNGFFKEVYKIDQTHPWRMRDERGKLIAYTGEQTQLSPFGAAKP
jgi:hypothetical protein